MRIKKILIKIKYHPSSLDERDDIVKRQKQIFSEWADIEVKDVVVFMSPDFEYTDIVLIYE